MTNVEIVILDSLQPTEVTWETALIPEVLPSTDMPHTAITDPRGHP